MRTGLLLLCCSFASLPAWTRYHRMPAPFTPTGVNYDVVYDRISLTVNPASSKTISAASVTTRFKTTVNNVSALQFDFDCTNLSITGASYHGAAITYTTNTSTNILTLTIPNIVTIGTLDSITINWNGTPPTPGSPVPSGYNYGTHNSTQKVIFTLGESFTGHNWWPCKESLSDKVDSVDLIVTAPNTYKVSGNGVVTEVASGSNTITTWKTRYATATYGINFAVANYSVSSSTLSLNGKTINLYNYLFPEDASVYSSSMNDIKAIIPMYSSVFGLDYPFADEKYGMTECSGNWGALEVQTMTFMSRGSGAGYSKYTIAHELSHQWFGDMITTNTWHMIWLNEGFAQYCESVIYPEHLDAANLASKRASLKSAVNTSSEVYVNDTSSANSIFAGSDQPYEKGAMFLSMMRTWLGDAKFFAAIKNYLSSRVQYGFTSVDTLQKYMQAQTGLSMSNFFSDWIYQKGYAKYNVQWAAPSNGIVIQLQQSPTTSGSGYFDMPVPIEILGPGLDTTVVVIDKRGILYNAATGATSGTNKISFRLSATPTSIKFDPQSLVLANGTISQNNSLTYTVLPVHSVKLTGNQCMAARQLSWTIRADERPAAVTLERSQNGTSFISVGKVNINQIDADAYTGTYTDVKAGDALYYRLRIEDAFQGFLYSNIVKMATVSAEVLRLTPNPVKSQLNVVIPAAFNDGELKLLIQNTAGQTLNEKIVESTGRQNLPLPVAQLRAGMYYLILINRKMEKLQAGFVRE